MMWALLSLLALLPASSARSQAAGQVLENPYEGVDWQRCAYLHSMSHQHYGQDDESLRTFYAMGYRHLAFSNYYPSAPTYPLPSDFLAAHPDAIGCPNAEHHSLTDSGIHFGALGSLYRSGDGRFVEDESVLASSPICVSFDKLNRYDRDVRPWMGIYRLDLSLRGRAAGAKDAEGTLTIDGALECDPETYEVRGNGGIQSRPWRGGSIYIRTVSDQVKVAVSFDARAARVTQLRLMQGCNRPWKDAFRAALDGELVDGKREGGLLFADGGGVVIHHPATSDITQYLAMLDFDSRVLGIEVWNDLTTGFGSPRGFYDKTPGPHMHYYQTWDTILKSGRRCFGFFVKDWNLYRRGRNVLVVPDLRGRTRPEKEREALRAYRKGAFFGLIAASAVDQDGKLVAPYDLSNFRFAKIVVRKDARRGPVAIEVAVDGNAPERPNVQIRFVTDQGIAMFADRKAARFALPRDASGALTCKFVRIEAFAYPATHDNGRPMAAREFRKLSVYHISQLHDKTMADDQLGQAPIGIADMLFSQPLMVTGMHGGTR